MVLRQRTAPLPLVFAFLCALFLLVDARGRGRGRGRRSYGGRRSNRGGDDEEEPAPPVVTFNYATELDGDGYLDKVEKVANSSSVSSSVLTLKQQYFPFVLFHVSWCQHCRHTLPEFENAAEMIHKGEEEGKLKGLDAPVKFFLIQCDHSPENMRQCEKHAGTSFPVLKLFRDKRAFQFTGPRRGKTMGEWSVRVSRPVVLEVSSKSEMTTYNEHGTLFIMKMRGPGVPQFVTKEWKCTNGKWLGAGSVSGDTASRRKKNHKQCYDLVRANAECSNTWYSVHEHDGDCWCVTTGDSCQDKFAPGYMSDYLTFSVSEADVAANPVLLHAWFELAYQYLEDYYFAVAPVDSEVHKLIPSEQSVTVRGKDIEALPFKGKVTAEKLEQWVKINRWQVVVEMSPEVAIKLLQTGRRVVTYAYKYRLGVKLDSKEEGQVYRQKATELRKKHDVIFASIDCSIRDNSELLGNLFPVVSVPSLFVFTGNGSLKSEVAYWEDPWLEAADLTYERIQELATSDWAYQDNSTNAWIKGWTKRVSRFGTGSFIGFIVVILLPLAFCGLCCLCFKELMTSDEKTDENQEEMKRVLQQGSRDSKAPVEQRRKLDSRFAQAPTSSEDLGESLIEKRTQEERETLELQEEREKLKREKDEMNKLFQEEWAKLQREKDGMKKKLQQHESEIADNSLGDNPSEEVMEDTVAQDDGLTKRR